MPVLSKLHLHRVRVIQELREPCKEREVVVRVRSSDAKLEANLGDVIGCKNTEGLPVVPTVLL